MSRGFESVQEHQPAPGGPESGESAPDARGVEIFGGKATITPDQMKPVADRIKSALREAEENGDPDRAFEAAKIAANLKRAGFKINDKYKEKLLKAGELIMERSDALRQAQYLGCMSLSGVDVSVEDRLRVIEYVDGNIDVILQFARNHGEADAALLSKLCMWRKALGADGWEMPEEAKKILQEDAREKAEFAGDNAPQAAYTLGRAKFLGVDAGISVEKKKGAVETINDAAGEYYDDGRCREWAQLRVMSDYISGEKKPISESAQEELTAFFGRALKPDPNFVANLRILSSDKPVREKDVPGVVDPLRADKEDEEKDSVLGSREPASGGSDTLAAAAGETAKMKKQPDWDKRTEKAEQRVSKRVDKYLDVRSRLSYLEDLVRWKAKSKNDTYDARKEFLEKKIEQAKEGLDKEGLSEADMIKAREKLEIANRERKVFLSEANPDTWNLWPDDIKGIRDDKERRNKQIEYLMQKAGFATLGVERAARVLNKTEEKKKKEQEPAKAKEDAERVSNGRDENSEGEEVAGGEEEPADDRARDLEDGLSNEDVSRRLEELARGEGLEWKTQDHEMAIDRYFHYLLSRDLEVADMPILISEQNKDGRSVREVSLSEMLNYYAGAGSSGEGEGRFFKNFVSGMDYEMRLAEEVSGKPKAIRFFQDIAYRWNTGLLFASKKRIMEARQDTVESFRVLLERKGNNMNEGQEHVLQYMADRLEETNLRIVQRIRERAKMPWYKRWPLAVLNPAT